MDDHAQFAQSESLALRGSLAVPQMLERGKFYGRLGAGDEPYAPYGPGWAIFAIPFQAAGRGAAALLHLEGDGARSLAEWAVSLSNAAALHGRWCSFSRS